MSRERGFPGFLRGPVNRERDVPAFLGDSEIRDSGVPEFPGGSKKRDSGFPGSPRGSKKRDSRVPGFLGGSISLSNDEAYAIPVYSDMIAWTTCRCGFAKPASARPSRMTCGGTQLSTVSQ